MVPLQLQGDSRPPARASRKQMRHMGVSPMLDVSSGLSEPSLLKADREPSSGLAPSDGISAPGHLAHRRRVAQRSEPCPSSGTWRYIDKPHFRASAMAATPVFFFLVLFDLNPVSDWPRAKRPRLFCLPLPLAQRIAIANSIGTRVAELLPVLYETLLVLPSTSGALWPRLSPWRGSEMLCHCAVIEFYPKASVRDGVV